MESLPLHFTLSTVVSHSTSTPCPANKSVKVLSHSALGNCHVQSQPLANFWLKSKLHPSSPLQNLAPNFFSKFFLSTPSINPASSKCSIHLGIRLSPITNLGNFCFSTILTFMPFWSNMEAATAPEGPAPITSTSTFSVFIF